MLGHALIIIKYFSKSILNIWVTRTPNQVVTRHIRPPVPHSSPQYTYDDFHNKDLLHNKQDDWSCNNPHLDKSPLLGDIVDLVVFYQI